MKKYFLLISLVFAIGALWFWQNSAKTDDEQDSATPSQRTMRSNRPVSRVLPSSREPIDYREAIRKGIDLAVPEYNRFPPLPKGQVRIQPQVFVVSGGVPADIEWNQRRFALQDYNGQYDFELPLKEANSPSAAHFYLKITNRVRNGSSSPYAFHFVQQIRARRNPNEPWREMNVKRGTWSSLGNPNFKKDPKNPETLPLIWVRGGRSKSTNDGWIEYTVLPYGAGQWSYDITPRIPDSIGIGMLRSPLRVDVGLPLKGKASETSRWPLSASNEAPSGGWIADLQWAPSPDGPWKHAPRRGEAGFPLHMFPGDPLWVRAVSRDPKRPYPLIPNGKPQISATFGETTFSYRPRMYNRTPAELTVVNVMDLQALSWKNPQPLENGKASISPDIVELPIIENVQSGAPSNPAKRNFPRASSRPNDLMMVSINGPNDGATPIETGIFVHSVADVLQRSKPIHTLDCILETGGATPTNMTATGYLKTGLNVRVNDVQLPLDKKLDRPQIVWIKEKKEVVSVPQTVRFADGNTKLDVDGMRVRLRAYDAQNRPAGQINGAGTGDDIVLTSAEKLEATFTAPAAGDYNLTAQVVDRAGQPLKQAPLYTLNLSVTRPLVNVQTVISVLYGDWEASPQPNTFQRSFWVLRQNMTTPLGKTTASPTYASINEEPSPVTLTLAGPKSMLKDSWLRATNAKTANHPTWIKTTPETVSGTQFYRYSPETPVSRQLRELEVRAKIVGNGTGGQP